MRQHHALAGGDPDRDQQGHGPDQLPRAPGGVCRHRALQLPRHDPALDVPHRLVALEEALTNDVFAGLITGNTYIMKPSERDPTACMALVELLRNVTES